MFATIFNAIVSNSKYPYSPYNDKSYDFLVVKFDKKYDFLRLMSKNYVLNITLDNSKVPLTDNVPKFRSIRDKTHLKQYFSETVEYIIIDVDDIHTVELRDKILDFFKVYDCMICESRSYNGIDNFNLKGILILEPVKNETLKFVASQIKQRLKDYCKCQSDSECNFDLASSHNVKYNAPIQKFNIILNSDGVPYHFEYDNSIKSYKRTYNTFKVISSQDYSNVTCIEDLCLKYFQSLGFEAFETNDSCIKFKHPSEQKTPGGYFWFRDSPYIMHHYNESKRVNIFDKIIKMPESKELLRNAIKYEDTFSKNATVVDVNFKFIELTDTIRSSIETFLSKPNGVFAIRSPMGTGKSTIINEIIVEAIEQDMRVLIITNRISVATDFSLKYHLKLYNKDKYNIHDSLICQYDSLYKYNIKYFDLVIFDEFISVILHSRNNLSNSIINLSKFYACFKAHVVIADAFLTGNENFLFQPKSDIFAINNTYRDETKLFLYNDFNYFILTILKTAEANKITVSCTSKNTVNALKELLKNHNLRVITLTSDTPETTKQLIYDKFKLEDNNIWDVLIYSPTLTVGVSNLNNVKYHFHFDSSNTCDVISSLQMIKRTRKTTEIHLYIKNRFQVVKTNFNDVKESYIQSLGKSTAHNDLFTFNDYGEPRLTKIGKNAIKTDIFKNILEYNHKQAFLFLLQYNFKDVPTYINETYSVNILTPYLNKVQDETMQKNLEIIDNYFILGGIDCFEVLKMVNDNNNTIKKIENIFTKIKPDTPNEIAKEIVTLEFKSPFLDKCIKYIYAYNYTNGIFTQDDIRNKISEMLKFNSDDIKFWLSLLKLDKSFKLKNTYSKKYVLSNQQLKKLLEECGYKIYNKDDDKIDLNHYEISKEILKYRDFMKI